MTPTVANLNPAISLSSASFLEAQPVADQDLRAIAKTVGITTITAMRSHSGRLDKK